MYEGFETTNLLCTRLSLNDRDGHCLLAIRHLRSSKITTLHRLTLESTRNDGKLNLGVCNGWVSSRK